MKKQDWLRGTGRTTAGVLEAIATALRQPGCWIAFEDHADNTQRAHRHIWFPLLRSHVRILGFKMDTGIVNKKACVRSLAIPGADNRP